jgi:hypothetical protein
VPISIVMINVESAPALRILAGRALVGGLCLAAGVALLALLTGSFDDTDWKVVATSVGFGVFSSTAAAGAALRLRQGPWAQVVGIATVVASVAAFGLLVAGLWIASGADALWRGWGIAALAALWGSHASLVLRPLRPSDSMAIRSLSAGSVAALGVDTSVGALALLGVIDHAPAQPLARLLGAMVILTLLSTALVPILRRLARHTGAVVPVSHAAAAFGGPSATRRTTDLSLEIAAVAARLDAMPPTPELRAEAARLRELAQEAVTPGSVGPRRGRPVR